MNDPNIKQVYAKALGDLILSYLDTQDFSPLPRTVETHALETISRIKAVLDDVTLDDSDCYGRIEAIVEEFYNTGLYTFRHDWGEKPRPEHPGGVFLCYRTTNSPFCASTVRVESGAASPAMIFRPTRFSTVCWRYRRRGRAPYMGS